MSGLGGWTTALAAWSGALAAGFLLAGGEALPPQARYDGGLAGGVGLVLLAGAIGLLLLARRVADAPSRAARTGVLAASLALLAVAGVVPVGGLAALERARAQARPGRTATPPRLTAASGGRPPVGAPDDSALAALVAGLDDAHPAEHNDPRVLALLRAGAAALPHLVEAVGDPALPGRGYAVYALGLALDAQPQPDPRGLAALLGCAGPGNRREVRSLAATALTRLGDRRCAAGLVALFRPEEPDLCAALERLSGRRFPDAEAAQAWWDAARAEFPPQVAPR